DTPPYPLDVASILTSPIQDVFPDLEVLHVRGYYSMQSEDFKVLVSRVLPGLLELSLFTAGKRFLKQVLGFVYLHPSLQLLKIDLGCLTKANRKELGLVEDETGRVKAIDAAYPYYQRRMRLEQLEHAQ
ncbi:hypothetical protein BGZ73_001655, partial [Actinomortierella ambigua]